jgi:hypothetical protein
MLRSPGVGFRFRFVMKWGLQDLTNFATIEDGMNPEQVLLLHHK